MLRVELVETSINFRERKFLKCFHCKPKLAPNSIRALNEHSWTGRPNKGSGSNLQFNLGISEERSSWYQSIESSRASRKFIFWESSAKALKRAITISCRILKGKTVFIHRNKLFRPNQLFTSPSSPKCHLLFFIFKQKLQMLFIIVPSTLITFIKTTTASVVPQLNPS